MVSFRHLTITNEAQTERIDLNDFDGYLMTSPTGFGIYRTSEYITIGNQRVQTNNRQTFQKITFTVTILGERNDWEVKYANLRDFISRNIKSGFRLYYTPHEDTRYIKCDINIVDKTEKDRANLPIKFEVQPLTLWLTDEQKDSVQQYSDSENIFAFNSEELEAGAQTGSKVIDADNIESKFISGENTPYVESLPSETRNGYKCNLKNADGFVVSTTYNADLEPSTPQTITVTRSNDRDDFTKYETIDNDWTDVGTQYYADFELVEDLYDEMDPPRPVYAISFGAGSLQVATLVNSGTETTPLKIKVYGEAINPYITLKRYGRNNVVQSVKFNNLTIPDGYYLEIDADPVSTHIELVNNETGERFDRSDYADIETNMYLTLPVGRYNLEVTDESGTNKCYAEVFYANQYYGG